MKVQQLISFLSNQDPNAEVVVGGEDWMADGVFPLVDGVFNLKSLVDQVRVESTDDPNAMNEPWMNNVEDGQKVVLITSYIPEWPDGTPVEIAL